MTARSAVLNRIRQKTMDKNMNENAEAPATHSQEKTDTKVPEKTQADEKHENVESLQKRLKEMSVKIQTLVHDARGMVAPIRSAGNVMGILSPDELAAVKNEFVSLIERNSKGLEELFNDTVHDTFVSVEYEKFEEFLGELIASYNQESSDREKLTLTFEPCKKEICEGMIVKFKRRDIKSILQNACKNALEHGKAKNLTVSIDGNEPNAPNGRYILITLTDNGNGIDPSVYPDIDQGRQRTTKEIIAGRNKLDHGTFLRALRNMIEGEEYGGKLSIENRHISAHHVDHGVTLKISLPLDHQRAHKKVETDTSAQAVESAMPEKLETAGETVVSSGPEEPELFVQDIPDELLLSAPPVEIVPAERHMSRRKLFTVVGGTAAAVFAGMIGTGLYVSSRPKKEAFASRETSPEVVPVPATDIEVNERGDIVSFVLHTPHGDMRYERGNMKHDFEFLQEANVGGASIIGFRPNADGAYGNEQYFISRCDAGIFAQVPYGYEKAFMTVPYEKPGSLAAAQKENVFPVHDTYFDASKKSWKSTSVSLLESRSLPSFWKPMDNAIKQVSQMRESETTQYLNNFNKALQRMRKLDDLYAMDPENSFIDSREQLNERLRTAKYRCDVAGPNLTETLRSSPLTQEEIGLAITQTHYLCFKNTKPDEAQRLASA
jgi:signal transduction histidine kinase